MYRSFRVDFNAALSVVIEWQPTNSELVLTLSKVIMVLQKKSGVMLFLNF